jgi:hypothetical protein
MWAVKHAASLPWVDEELDKCMAQGGKSVRVDIRVTNEDGLPTRSSGSQNELEKGIGNGTTPDRESLAAVTSFGHRPAMDQVLSGLVGGGRTIVLGCGPESLKIDLSNAVAGLQRRVLKGEAQEVRLHTETFGW